MKPLPNAYRTVEEAARMEAAFLDGFERNLALAEALPDPILGRLVPLRRLRVDWSEIDRRIEIERLACLPSRHHARSVPPGRARIARWSRSRLLSRSPRIGMAAVVVHPEQDYSRWGRSGRPAGIHQIEEAVHRVRSRPFSFAWIAILSPTGWEPEAILAPGTGREYQVLPVVPHPSTDGFLLLAREAAPMPWLDTLRTLFLGRSPGEAETLDPPLAPPDLLAQVTALRATNEAALESIDRLATSLEERLREATRRPKAPESSFARERMRTDLERLQRRIEHCRARSSIHAKNLEVADDMAARLEEIAALGSSGVSPERVSAVVQDYERQLEEYVATLDAARELSRLDPLAFLAPRTLEPGPKALDQEEPEPPPCSLET